MKTNLLIGSLAAAVIIGGGAYYFVGMSNGAADTANEIPQAATPTPGAFSGSITDLSRRGGQWKCDVDTASYTGGGPAIATGVVYVSGDNVRADFTAEVQQVGTLDAHMIVDGEYAYSWNSLVPQGFKTKVITEAERTDAPASGQGVTADTNYRYDCQITTPDPSLFKVPTNITFTTF